MEILYSVHGLQIKNIDLHDILKSFDNYKNIKPIDLNRAPPSLKEDNDDLTRFIQHIEFDNDERTSSLKNHDSLDRYGKDVLYNYHENLNPLLKSLIKQYNNLYKNKAKVVASSKKERSSNILNLAPAGNSDYSKLYVILNPKVDLPKSSAKDIAKL